MLPGHPSTDPFGVLAIILLTAAVSVIVVFSVAIIAARILSG